LGRFLLAKTFEGGIVGTGAGEMLSAGDPAAGSAGYVALEWVSGRIGARAGRFALQHSGTMDRGGQRLSITVVPGTGSGELAGLAGHLELSVADGVHGYTLHYRLPD
ncbi:MAG: DUF3224 domain-containing protein, partial [Burkholderiaceae bacterium]